MYDRGGALRKAKKVVNQERFKHPKASAFPKFEKIEKFRSFFDWQKENSYC